ncbi:hypothetical protein JHK84_028353 [Glycine max]|nr:hypothetical protein JHK85_028766 [Glycine max]KAG5151881.1 hypothetical protein JHK84_028353 [Glycine max]
MLGVVYCYVVSHGGAETVGFVTWLCFRSVEVRLELRSINSSSNLRLWGIQSARHLDGSSLPEKIWLKQQFSIGVNDVTRVLERMKPCTELESSTELISLRSNHTASSVKLQAVLVASDCNPRWLTKHLLSLASSRNVPLVFVRDTKQGSLRLGELVQLKTAIAIGIKVKGSTINKIIQQVIQGDRFELSPEGQNSARIFDAQSNFQDPD